MVVYNFKKMAPVPPADDLIDIILTRTQVSAPLSETSSIVSIIGNAHVVCRCNLRFFCCSRQPFSAAGVLCLRYLVPLYPRKSTTPPISSSLVVVYTEDQQVWQA